MVYLHNGVLLTMINNEISQFIVTYMELEGVMLREMRQKEKRQIMNNLAHFCNI